MTWLWRICFSGLRRAARALAATLSGVVRLVGLARSRGAQAQGLLGRRGVAGAASARRAASRAPTAPARADGAEGQAFHRRTCWPSRSAPMVEFPNFDPIFHNAFSNFSGQTFDVGLYAPGTSRAVTFTRTGHRARLLQHPPHHERRDRGAGYAVVRACRTARAHSPSRDVPPGEYRLQRLSRARHREHARSARAARYRGPRRI